MYTHGTSLLDATCANNHNERIFSRERSISLIDLHAICSTVDNDNDNDFLLKSLQCLLFHTQYDIDTRTRSVVRCADLVVELQDSLTTHDFTLYPQIKWIKRPHNEIMWWFKFQNTITLIFVC